ncbi:MAG: hypothetical protein SFU53_02980 [Terrimicrobiaceae bacterium]|nr:hypothetical protein [Terrimicrobiaceae bacterium]
MKLLLAIAIFLTIAAGASVLFIWNARVTLGGHENVVTERIAYREWPNREAYIAYLKRTEDHQDEELWRRIEAVKKKETWP